MASWSTKRKYGYLFAVLAVLALIAGAIFFSLFYKSPTCSDNKQNGDERGVDCGGSCAKLCPADFAAPKVLWSYSMRIVPGVYNSLAYIQNPNQTVSARSVSYLFKLYDNQGLLISQKEGKTFVPAGQRFAVFMGGIQTGERVPVRTTFEFISDPQWAPDMPLKNLSALSINVDQAKLPWAEALVKNTSISETTSNLDVFIILYDKDDNRIAFSKTIIEKISPGETMTLVFTWPEAFDREVIRSELVFMPR